MNRWTRRLTNLLNRDRNMESPRPARPVAKLTSQRQRLFEGRIDAERKYRYYSVKADRYRLTYSILAFVIGAASFVTVLVPETDLPFDLRIVFPFIASIATLGLISFDIPGKASRAENAKRFYLALNIEWRELWWKHLPDHHSASLRKEMRLLELREHQLIDTGIGIDSKLSVKCQRQATDVILGEYTREGSK